MKLIKLLLGAGVLCLSFVSPHLWAKNEMPAPDPKMETKMETQSAPTQAVVVADKININSATADEIKRALVGIGAKKADAIVQYREKHGPFTAVEQLLEVQGIGKATLEKNKDRISL